MNGFFSLQQKLILLSAFLIFCLSLSCKKNKPNNNNNNNADSGPVTNLNGWSYHGNSTFKSISSDNSFQLYLSKVHTHPTGEIDVFYGEKFKMLNYYGSGPGIYINSARWIVGSDRKTLVDGNRQDEFNQQSGLLFKPVFKTSLGETYVMDWLFPIQVKVKGLGKSEFSVYNPGNLLPDIYFSNHYSQYSFGAGSFSPESMLSSPVCHLSNINRIVDTEELWNAHNIAIGKHPGTQLYSILSFVWDSMYIKVSSVSPQDFYSSDYGTVRKVQPMFLKNLKEIIPQWAKGAALENIPYYFQGNSQPEFLYILFQNSLQLFLVKYNLNTFKFELVNVYNQPRSTGGFKIQTHNFQWMPDESGSFIFTEKRNTGTSVEIFKSGNREQLALPTFNDTAVPSVMDIKYEDGKFWMIVADKDKKIYLYSKSK